MKARNLAEVINYFDPRKPLSGEMLEVWYAARRQEMANDAIEQMQVFLSVATAPVKLLFTGHRGSGKTTELNRLAGRIAEKFCAVPFSVESSLNLFDLNYVDLMFGLANSVFKYATDEAVIARSAQQLVQEEVLEPLSIWFAEKITGSPLNMPNSPTELSAKLNAQVVELEAKFSLEARTREEIRERLEPRLRELLEYLNIVIAQIRHRTKREVLIMVEGIDKLDLAKSRELFLEHAASLTRPAAYIIYTFPIALRYDNDFPQISRNFDEHCVLPNVKLWHRDGALNADGRAVLREVINRRLEAPPESLITPDAVEELLTASGGVMVTLIDLMQRAAVFAVMANRTVIDEESVRRAIVKARQDYQTVLKPAHYDVLRQRHQDKAVVNENADRELLHNLSLLEYRNDEVWYDVHPIVQPLLE